MTSTGQTGWSEVDTESVQGLVALGAVVVELGNSLTSDILRYLDMTRAAMPQYKN